MLEAVLVTVLRFCKMSRYKCMILLLQFTEACSDLTHSFHLFQDVPRSRRLFGLCVSRRNFGYSVICHCIEVSFVSFVHVYVFKFTLLVFYE
jgi:hypothetical protein